MDVIFLQDVPNVANAGDRRRVADGFARNYLLPKQLAALATPEMLKRTERIKEAGRDRRVRETGRLEELASHLEGLAVNVTGRVAPTGLYYGAISQTRLPVPSPRPPAATSIASLWRSWNPSVSPASTRSASTLGLMSQPTFSSSPPPKNSPTQ